MITCSLYKIVVCTMEMSALTTFFLAKLATRSAYLSGRIQS